MPIACQFCEDWYHENFEYCKSCSKVRKGEMAKWIKKELPKKIYIDDTNIGNRPKIDIPWYELESKKTHRQLAKKYGCSYSTIYRKRRNLRASKEKEV